LGGRVLAIERDHRQVDFADGPGILAVERDLQRSAAEQGQTEKTEQKKSPERLR